MDQTLIFFSSIASEIFIPCPYHVHIALHKSYSQRLSTTEICLFNLDRHISVYKGCRDPDPDKVPVQPFHFPNVSRTPSFIVLRFPYFRFVSLAASLTKTMPVVKTPAMTHGKLYHNTALVFCVYSTRPHRFEGFFSLHNVSIPFFSTRAIVLCQNLRAIYRWRLL